jgi:DNA repair protein NreA
MGNAENIKFEVLSKISKTNFRSINLEKFSQLNTFSPPSVFVGSKLKYPEVNVGILSPIQKDENAWIFDAPKHWAKENFGIKEVMQLRDNLLNSRFRSKVFSARTRNKFVDIAKEVAIASKPVDLEIELLRKMEFSRKGDRVLTSQGLKAPLKNARIVSNTKVSRILDKLMNDELKSSESLKILYGRGFDENALSKILSVGVLGMKKDKKLVPTRWSITATDDTLGKQILERVRTYRWIENHSLFFGDFLGNQYLILLFPGVWSYELFELYYPGSSWNPSKSMKASTDDEGFSGRKTYATNTAGGYYATRLPILECLDKLKRQASVLVIRLETPSYWASLGVWVVRESVRKALGNSKGKGMFFSSRKDLLDSVEKIAKIKYNFDPNFIFKRSKLLERIKTEKTLNQWF